MGLENNFVNNLLFFLREELGVIDHLHIELELEVEAWYYQNSSMNIFSFIWLIVFVVSLFSVSFAQERSEASSESFDLVCEQIELLGLGVDHPVTRRIQELKENISVLEGDDLAMFFSLGVTTGRNNFRCRCESESTGVVAISPRNENVTTAGFSSFMTEEIFEIAEQITISESEIVIQSKRGQLIELYSKLLVRFHVSYVVEIIYETNSNFSVAPESVENLSTQADCESDFEGDLHP